MHFSIQKRQFISLGQTYILGWLLMFVLPLVGQAQSKVLQAGFDAHEYLELLQLSARQADTLVYTPLPAPKNHTMVYRSPVVGLQNRWDLWLSKENVGVISIRGTVRETPSWLENFYAAMVPATGSLQLSDTTQFNYQLAANPNATVHIGWLLGLAYLSPSIRQKLTEYYTRHRVKEFVIVGHSQGGAIAYLLRSYLYYLQKQEKLPQDILIKTYCSAAPKPGNLYYAYDFDFITRNGWGFTVVNEADWVPETPFSVQTLNDFNTANPFTQAKGALKKQNLLVRWYGTRVYNKLDRSTRKAERNFRKYLGNFVYKQVKKTLPQYKQPSYAPGSNYMRAGVPVVLATDEAYFKQFPNDPKNVFAHHLFLPYYRLTQKWYTNSEQKASK